MAKYMTQVTRAGKHKSVTYYCKQSDDHPSHHESSGFTKAAKAAYAAKYSVDEDDVELGNYASNQGVPTGGDVAEIANTFKDKKKKSGK